MPTETSSGAVVYLEENNQKKFLVLHYEEGHWDLPKGHVEAGETLEETAIRETKEETGLIVDLHPTFKEHITYFFKNKQGVVVQKTVYFFIGKAKTKEIVLSDEHIGYVWLSYEHTLQKLTYDLTKEVVKKAYSFLSKKTLKDF